MKYIPILFSSVMVNAILDGRKTMTRRIMKPQPTDDWMANTRQFSGNGSTHDYKGRQLFWISDGKDGEIKCPYGQPGDILWVRESFIHNPPEYDWELSSTEPYYSGEIFYKADEGIDRPGPWKPSIHMPKSACRIFLEAIDVRVERLQDITEEDAIAEGVLSFAHNGSIFFKNYIADSSGYGDPNHDYPTVPTAKDSFQTLWESINGPESWEANPWVWVISFRRIEKPENFK